MGKISNFFGPKASTHKEFVKFVVLANERRQVAAKLQEGGGVNNRLQVTTCKGEVIPGKVNKSLAASRRKHIKGCKKLEGFLKTQKAKELYGEKLTNQALEGLKQIRKGEKRFDAGLLNCFEGFVDTETYKQMWTQRDTTITRFSENIDAVNALAEQGGTTPQEKRCVVGEAAKRDVEKAHQQAVESARLFKLTCLPRANADSVSATQTELANWLNKAFAKHPYLKEFRASSFVDALFGAYPNKIMELNRKLDDLYAQLHAGSHDAELLTQITKIGQQQTSLIESYLRKLALVGQLLADQFPWEEAPFGSLGIAVAAGHDLNRLAQAYLSEDGPMMEMHQFAVNAQAEVLAIWEGGLAVDGVRVQVNRLIEEMTPKAGAHELTPEQQTYSDWLKGGMAAYPVFGNLNYLLKFRWDSLNDPDSEYVIASIDGYLASIDALRCLAVEGASDGNLSPAQKELLISTSQVLGRLHQQLKDPKGALMVIRQRALHAEADTNRYVEAQREQPAVRKQRVDAAMVGAWQAYQDFLDAFKHEAGEVDIEAQQKLRQWVTGQLLLTDATTKLSLASVGTNLPIDAETIQALGEALRFDVKTWKETSDHDESRLTGISRGARGLVRRIDEYLAQIEAVGHILTRNPPIENLPVKLQERRVAAGKSMRRLWEEQTHPESELMKLRAFALKTQVEAEAQLRRAETQSIPTSSNEDLDRFSHELDDLFADIQDGDLAEDLRQLPDQARVDAPDVGAMSSAELASMLNISLNEVEPQKPVESPSGAQWMEEFAKGIDDLLSDIPDENQISARYQPVQEAPKEASPARGFRRAHVSHFRRKPAQVPDQHAEMPTQPIQTKRRSADLTIRTTDALTNVGTVEELDQILDTWSSGT